MSTDNICLYKEVARKYTCCNLKTTELLNYALIGVCAVIRSNTVCEYCRPGLHLNICKICCTIYRLVKSQRLYWPWSGSRHFACCVNKFSGWHFKLFFLIFQSKQVLTFDAWNFKSYFLGNKKNIINLSSSEFAHEWLRLTFWPIKNAAANIIKIYFQQRK